jgi:hypothetical protein
VWNRHIAKLDREVARQRPLAMRFVREQERPDRVAVVGARQRHRKVGYVI